MSITAFGISKHLSDLVGRHVLAKEVSSCAFSEANRTACYSVQPLNKTAIVRIDFGLLVELGGAMIGYPKTQIEQQVKSGKLDENLEDVTNEVMNVFAAVVVAKGRATFRGLHLHASEYSDRAEDLEQGKYFPLRLQITMTGSKPGHMLIGSDCG